MKYILDISEIKVRDRSRIGEKAYRLSNLYKKKNRVPDSLCLCVEAFDEFISKNGLRERILLEINRKKLRDMRWEEMWDAALRIRNFFLNTKMPKSLKIEISEKLNSKFQNKPVAIRSSAPGEDSPKSSFAGLHDSFLNIRGIDSILEHIILVWASLFSDRAILYRKELDINFESASIAVLIQEIIDGDKSGITFSQSPNDSSKAVVEAVYGINQGLVDGSIEPDRWFLNRGNAQLVTFQEAIKEKIFVLAKHGLKTISIDPEKSKKRVLSSDEVNMVFKHALNCEKLFQSPQDIEWTFKKNDLYILQSRPITKFSGDKSDNKSWYLGLRRSLDNLEELRKKIEGKLLPKMSREAEALSRINLVDLDNNALAKEVIKRNEINLEWESVYWNEFIPFAHGARLFGQVYNDTVRPSDPYEFVNLLGATKMKSLKRNRTLENLAEKLKKSPDNYKALKDRDFDKLDSEFMKAMNDFITDYDDTVCFDTNRYFDRDILVDLLLKICDRKKRSHELNLNSVNELKEKFLKKFPDDKREYIKSLLNLARASYRLRDDDNIYLGKIKSKLIDAVEEAKKRIEMKDEDSDYLNQVLSEIEIKKNGITQLSKKKLKKLRYIPRQLVGQPAVPGVASGKARIIKSQEDLFSFKTDEIIVCDAIDPNMTFIVPLASAIVERRGGMLIHGAIIAREYGLPCVTGISNATSYINEGDEITVDGYLGIVTVNSGKGLLNWDSKIDNSDEPILGKRIP